MSDQSRLRAIDTNTFLEMQLPVRETLISPIIFKQSIGMVFAQRGIGKTNFSLTLAAAIACGKDLFDGRWQVPTANKVLYIDGEMPANALQQRLRKIRKYFGDDVDLTNLKLITPDTLPGDVPMPNLATLEGQAALEPELEDVALVIIDNISCLCSNGRENEAESWEPLQRWSLMLRKRGTAVIFIHHANKTGGQRGSNKKEDIMDTVVLLKYPKNYDRSEGARFEVHYEKARGFYGQAAEPFEIQMLDTEDGGGVTWQASDIVDENADKVVLLAKQGLSQRAIAEQTNLNVATVNKLLKKERLKAA